MDTRTKFSIFNFQFSILVLILLFGISLKAFAATNIDPTDKWVWNDVTGWIDFYITNSVKVKGDKIEGYAVSSAIGNISLDCATGPAGSNCSIPYNITNDFNGNLAGWAWSDQIGWISFSCSNQSTCGTSNYGVKIIASEFSGFAWNDAVGWISFNCLNVSGSCSTSNYKLRTSAGSVSQVAELTSSVFDGGSVDGVVLNSIMWKGNLGGSSAIVEFQIASSDSVGGPWSFIGDDQTVNTFYRPVGPDVFRPITGHINKRYFRYKIFLRTDIIKHTAQL